MQISMLFSPLSLHPLSLWALMEKFTFLLALLPIALILILMVGLRWGAARAGVAGYLSALLIAALFFGAGPRLLAYAHARALLLAVDVLLIIWAAFLLYRVVDEAGAICIIGQALPHLTADTGMQALVIGWVFASFLQGVGGFGVPVAVIAPILAGLGFSPLAAVVIPSYGCAWAVTFGSLGSSMQALVSATGLPDQLLTSPAAVFLGISALLVGLLIAFTAGSWRGVRRLVLPVILLAAGMGVVQYLAARTNFWNTASFLGGLAGMVISLPLARHFRGDQKNNGKLDLKSLGLALSAYAILVVVTLGVQLIPAIREGLSQVVIQFQFPQVATSLGFVTPAGASRKIVLLRHAGATLLYASILAYLLYWKAGKYHPGAVQRITGGMVKRVLPPSLSIIAMITMAVMMDDAGMTSTLARGMAGGMGSVFPVVSPWIGALGAFMTGSNTNSNVVFAALQLRTAQLLQLPVEWILAAQTAGAALASVMAPAKVVVGACTAGMEGKEGDVIRALLPGVALLVLLISLLTVIVVFIK